MGISARTEVTWWSVGRASQSRASILMEALFDLATAVTVAGCTKDSSAWGTTQAYSASALPISPTAGMYRYTRMPWSASPPMVPCSVFGSSSSNPGRTILANWAPLQDAVIRVDLALRYRLTSLKSLGMPSSSRPEMMGSVRLSKRMGMYVPTTEV